MTSWKLAEDAELAQALLDAVKYASPDALNGLRELQVCAEPQNGYQLAHLGWSEREPVTRALRSCAESGHPNAQRLRQLADALDDSVAAQRMNRRV